MSITSLARLITCVAAGLVASACGGSSGGDDGNSAPQAVTVDFTASIAGTPFACGESYAGIGSTSTTIRPNDLRFYVSELHFIRPDGEEVFVDLDQDGEWQVDDVALVDFEDGTGPCSIEGTSGTHTTITGTIPEGGPFERVHFTIGVPFERNHADSATAPAPLGLSAMFWDWNFGYKFLKFDSDVDSIAAGFRVHIGSTGCSGNDSGAVNECANPNRIDVDLEGYELGRSIVHADLERLFAGTDVSYNTPETAPGCMSFPGDPECESLFPALGLPFGDTQAGVQAIFSLR